VAVAVVRRAQAQTELTEVLEVLVVVLVLQTTQLQLREVLGLLGKDFLEARLQVELLAIMTQEVVVAVLRLLVEMDKHLVLV
jgi:hypothetical protein